MEIEYTNNVVNWVYDNKEITYEANGIELVSYNSEIVCIEIVYDDMYEY